MDITYIGYFIGGILFKLIDDHYDRGYIDKPWIYIIQLIFLGLLMYSTHNVSYTFILLIGTFICYFNNQVDTPYYKLLAIIVILTEGYYLLNKNNRTLIKNTFTDPYLLISLMGFGIIVTIEDKLFKIEYSRDKMLNRIMILIFMVCMFFAEEIYNILNINNNIIKSFVNALTQPMCKMAYAGIAGYMSGYIFNNL